MKLRKKTIPTGLLLDQALSVLTDDNSVEIPVKGSSMMPFIVEGRDSVILKCVGKSLKSGDIVLAFLPQRGYVLHRIKHIDSDTVILHGDGNLSGDESCGLSDIKARACGIRHRSGRVTDCGSRCFAHRSHLWNASPAIVKRVVLKIYRML